MPPTHYFLQLYLRILLGIPSHLENKWLLKDRTRKRVRTFLWNIGKSHPSADAAHVFCGGLLSGCAPTKPALCTCQILSFEIWLGEEKEREEQERRVERPSFFIAAKRTSSSLAKTSSNSRGRIWYSQKCCMLQRQVSNFASTRKNELIPFEWCIQEIVFVWGALVVAGHQEWPKGYTYKICTMMKYPYEIAQCLLFETEMRECHWKSMRTFGMALAMSFQGSAKCRHIMINPWL